MTDSQSNSDQNQIDEQRSEGGSRNVRRRWFLSAGAAVGAAAFAGCSGDGSSTDTATDAATDTATATPTEQYDAEDYDEFESNKTPEPTDTPSGVIRFDHTSIAWDELEYPKVDECDDPSSLTDMSTQDRLEVLVENAHEAARPSYADEDGETQIDDSRYIGNGDADKQDWVLVYDVEDVDFDGVRAEVHYKPGDGTGNLEYSYSTDGGENWEWVKPAKDMYNGTDGDWGAKDPGAAYNNTVEAVTTIPSEATHVRINRFGGGAAAWTPGMGQVAFFSGYSGDTLGTDDYSFNPDDVETPDKIGLDLTADPGETGVENTFTFTVDMSTWKGDQKLTQIQPGFGEKPGLGFSNLTKDQISIMGDDLGELSIKKIENAVGGTNQWQKVTLAVPEFNMADESGSLTVTISGIPAENAGEWNGWFNVYGPEGDKQTAATDGYELEGEGSSTETETETEASMDSKFVVNADPGESGTTNEFTFTADLSDYNDDTDVDQYEVGFGKKPGVHMPDVELSQVTIEGDELGAIEPDSIAWATEPDWESLNMNLTNSFTPSEETKITVTLVDITVDNAGTWGGWVNMWSAGEKVKVFETDYDIA